MTGKKETLCRFLKKATKKNIKGYRPVSLLPICGDLDWI